MIKKTPLLFALLLGTYSTSLVFASSGYEEARRNHDARLEKRLIAKQEKIRNDIDKALKNIEERYPDPKDKTREAAESALRIEHDTKMEEAQKEFEREKSLVPSDEELLM